MADGDTIGQRLARLRARSGLSLAQVAEQGGFKGKSSVQRYFEYNYDQPFVPPDVAADLAKAFVGKGDPPITAKEVFVASGLQFVAEHSNFFEIPETVRNVVMLPRDVQIYGTALGGEASFDKAVGQGKVRIEQGTLDQAETIGYLRRPPALEGRNDVYGIYIAGESMFPRFSHGEAQYVDPRRPPSLGDDVVVHLRSEDEQDGERVSDILVKRLRRRSASFIELEQFNPPAVFRIETARIKAVHRIIPLGELFG